MRDVFVARGAPRERIAVVMNGADETTFVPARIAPSADGRFRLIHHGTILEESGIDTIVSAVAQLRERIPSVALDVYGDGPYRPELESMVDELELHQHVTFHGFVPMNDLLDGIADADAGLVAMKPGPYRDLTLCNKMFDLITMRRPVICARSKAVTTCFPDGSLKYFDADDHTDLARAIEELYSDPDESHRLVQSATQHNEPYRWPHQRERYLSVIESLLSTGDPNSAEPVASR
jgi:glycosyltransferase involved in cell wall biosynthesis